MANDRFTIEPGVRAFVHDLGLSWARVTRRAGLAGDLLAAGPVHLTTEQYYALWSALADEGAPRELALDIGDAITAEVLAAPLMAALSSPNLRVAAARIAQYKPLVGPLALEVVDPPDELRVVCRWPGGRPPTLLGMSELVFWVALARLGTRHRVRPLGVGVPDPPSDPAALEAYLGAPVRRARTHSVAFRAADADRPFLTENEAMWQLLSPGLGRRLAEQEADATVGDRVRAALYESLPAGDSSIGAVTRKLAVSPRTLQRQLSDEGTSYRAVLSRTRADLAHRYLSSSDLRTDEIAYLLGYDDIGSFYRAFRTWTGSTPDSVRAIARRSRRRTT